MDTRRYLLIDVFCLTFSPIRVEVSRVHNTTTEDFANSSSIETFDWFIGLLKFAEIYYSCD